jgi:asparagine synthase (glutamine-hydrolysing)
MNALCGFLSLRERLPSDALGRVEAMLARPGFKDANGLGTKTASGSHCVLGVREEPPRKNLFVSKHPQKDWWTAADVRLDNRAELRSRLRHTPWLADDWSDGMLLLAAYEQWGPQFAGQLIGDFAFVLFDLHDRRAVAARDPSALRTLFYSEVHAGQTIALATTPSQLLTLNELDRRPDDVTLAEFIAGTRHSDPSRTEFSRISRIPAGHSLTWTDHGKHLQRFWSPPIDADGPWRSKSQCVEELESLIATAISERLRAGGRSVILLSGGYDSAAITGVSGHLCRERIIDQSAVHLLTIDLAGTPSDETRYVQESVAASPFRHTLAKPDIGLDEIRSSIRRRKTIVGGTIFQTSEYCARGLAEESARQIITGDGGDELFGDSGILHDLLARRRYLRMLREAAAWRGDGVTPNWPIVRRLMRWSSLQRIAACRAPGPDCGQGPPAYLSHACLRVLRSREAAHSTERRAPGSSAARLGLLRRIVRLADHDRSIEALSLEGQDLGLRYAAPFLDRRLVDFMLCVPIEWRAPGGQFKGFFRQAIGHHLPSMLGRRNNKTPRVGFAAVCMRRWLAQFLSEDPPSGWAIGNLVIPDRAEAFLREVGSAAFRWRDRSAGNRLVLAWRLLAAELWLRALVS